ncbi:hypothetical protein HDU91_001855 [Kappamyces sp. JEL0680]|nr:hypothetical protein HDU91_001855 [Kappamyces sp. JEL0680]
METDGYYFQVYYRHNGQIYSDRGELDSVRDSLHPLPLFCLCHGAGHSAMTFSLFSQSLQALLPCDILTWDARGHGNSRPTKDVDLENDLSLDTLAADMGRIINHWRGAAKQVILLGHSLGGAVATQVMAAGLVKNVLGCGVIDVVEGTALESLSHMNSILVSQMGP